MPSKPKTRRRQAPVVNTPAAAPSQITRAGVWALVLAAFWTLSFQRVSFRTTANDLGRHLRDGELLLQKTSAILHTNYYSYTHPDFPFLNHHWLATILFFLVFRAFGAAGLNLFYVAMGTAAFCLYFRIAEREAGIGLAGALAALSMPFLALRPGIRPEVFSVVLLAVFFTLCWSVYRGWIRAAWLWTLPALELIWVNLHPGFALGPVLLGVFLVSEVVSKWLGSEPSPSKPGTLAAVLALCLLAGLGNPNGVRGLLFPLNVSGNYAMPVRENYSVLLLPNEQLAKMLELAVPILAVVAFLVVRRKMNPEWPLLGFALPAGLMSLFFFRIYVFFGFFLLVSLCVLARKLFPRRIPAWATACLIGIAVLNGAAILASQSPNSGIGLNPGDDQLARFMSDNHIHGRVFSGYGSGGYLIHYFPEQPVYIDSRPEAYPAAFIRDDYLLPLRDEEAWKRIDATYRFDAICFVQFAGEEGQFLLRRMHDPQWALVAGGAYVLLVRRTPEFADVIAQHEIQVQ